MTDLLDFKRSQIVGAYMARVIVTKTTELFGAARSAVSRVMTTFEKEGKISSLKQNSRRKLKVFDKVVWTLLWIVKKDQKNTAPKTTAKLNNHLENQVSSKTVRIELPKTGGLQ